MTVTRLNTEELKKWHDWLKASHGIDALPGQVVYQCDLEYTLFLTPFRSLSGLCTREQRYEDGLLATFEILPGVRTIANVWGEPLSIPVGTHASDKKDAREKELGVLAAAGYVWWGTESLLDPPSMTSLLYVTHETFFFPSPGSDGLKDSSPPPQELHTDLDLV
jgi:hypothetical protein